MGDITHLDIDPLRTDTSSQYPCADYRYTLTYMISAESFYHPIACALPWTENPASVAACSASEAPQISQAMIQNFADPFDQVVRGLTFRPR